MTLVDGRGIGLKLPPSWMTWVASAIILVGLLPVVLMIIVDAGSVVGRLLWSVLAIALIYVAALEGWSSVRMVAPGHVRIQKRDRIENFTISMLILSAQMGWETSFGRFEPLS